MPRRVMLVSASLAWALLPMMTGCKRAAPTSKTAERATSKSDHKVDIPTFTDVLKESGITFQHHFLDSETGSTYQVNPYDHGSGVCVGDVNGDGLDDIYFMDFLGPNHLYINLGGWRFKEVAGQAGVAVERALSVGAAFGDYDNDGDQDLFVTTYRGGNHLFRNRGDGVFDEVTDSAGVGYNGHSSAATWFDYDLDGDLDLYICNIGKFTTETISQEADYFYSGTSLPFGELIKTPERRVLGEPDILYRNNADGTFTNVTDEAGIQSTEWNADAAVADFDLDGDSDLYVSNMFGANHLYRNNGNGTFEDVTVAALERTSWGGMGARFFDSDGDPYPDLLVVDMHSDMWLPPQKKDEVLPYAKYNTPAGNLVSGWKIISTNSETLAKSVLFGNTYFVNNGDGTFSERSAETGLETWFPWSITIGDYNNDGWQDVFVASGMGYPYYYWPNRLFIAEGKGRYREAAWSAGIEPPASGKTVKGAEVRGKPFTRSSRTAATADFDLDGDLDIVVNNFNHEPYLLRNDSPKGNWLRLELQGRRANRNAIGARVVVKAKGRSWYRRLVGSEGYLTQSSLNIHIGLGEEKAIDTVEVYWPGQENPQIVHSPAIQETVRIVQE